MTSHPVTKENKQLSSRRCETCFYGTVEKEKGYGTHRYCSHPDFQYKTSKRLILIGTEIDHIQEHGCTCYQNKEREICNILYCGIQSGMCVFLPEKQQCSLLSRSDPLEVLEKWRGYQSPDITLSTLWAMKTKFIKELRTNPDAVIKRGKEEGWL